jgi:hypothetical protein
VSRIIAACIPKAVIGTPNVIVPSTYLRSSVVFSRATSTAIATKSRKKRIRNGSVESKSSGR